MGSQRVMVGQTVVGTIGELSPELLDRWNIGVPISVFTLNLTAFPQKHR